VNRFGFLPQLDSRRCTGCGDCVAVCPADCLAMAGLQPWLSRPRECISCSLCEEMCPADAITMTPIPNPTDDPSAPTPNGHARQTNEKRRE
jgi:NAD-dependent dihydropyrimidine dehydrogenase PreA subunit